VVKKIARGGLPNDTSNRCLNLNNQNKFNINMHLSLSPSLFIYISLSFLSYLDERIR
ncbi:MAG: hypothetical protein ACI90V_003663, partial [Bacillariaceae sp.]|jgi:hypothetical protein